MVPFFSFLCSVLWSIFFPFGHHCMAISSNYVLWLILWYLQTFLMLDWLLSLDSTTNIHEWHDITYRVLTTAVSTHNVFKVAYTWKLTLNNIKVIIEFTDDSLMILCQSSRLADNVFLHYLMLLYHVALKVWKFEYDNNGIIRLYILIVLWCLCDLRKTSKHYCRMVIPAWKYICFFHNIHPCFVILNYILFFVHIILCLSIIQWFSP